MRPLSRSLLISLAVTFVYGAAVASPALAVATHGTTATPTPSPSVGTPSGTPSSTPTPSGPLSSTAAQRVTFGIGPAFAVPSDHLVDGRPYLTALSSGGGALRDSVALLNYARKPVRLNVYPADATQNGSTTFNLSLANHHLTGAGSWLTINGHKSEMITVPASHAGTGGRNIPGRVLVPIEGLVPLHASPGDHVAAIVAELDARAKNKAGANITLQQRLGVAVYIHLLGQLVASVKVGNLTTHWQEPGSALGTGRFTVSFTLINTGNVRLNASTLLNTTRWFAGPVRSYPGEIANIFPGTQITVTKTVDGLFGLGPWHTTASAFATPVDPTDNLSVSPQSQTASLWAIPWILLAIIVAIIVVLLLGWRYVQYRRRRRKQRELDQVGRRKKSAKGARAKGTRVKRGGAKDGAADDNAKGSDS